MFSRVWGDRRQPSASSFSASASTAAARSETSTERATDVESALSSDVYPLHSSIGVPGWVTEALGVYWQYGTKQFSFPNAYYAKDYAVQVASRMNYYLDNCNVKAMANETLVDLVTGPATQSAKVILQARVDETIQRAGKEGVSVYVVYRLGPNGSAQEADWIIEEVRLLSKSNKIHTLPDPRTYGGYLYVWGPPPA